MESNKDEALKCLGIAQRHRDSANYAAARKFCEKSISLFRTPEAEALLDSIKNMATNDAEPSASSSSAQPRPSTSGMKHRAPEPKAEPQSQKREYTPEQEATVKRVIKCEITEYYEILSLKKDCDDGDVKKAYKKLALQLHPDKNGAPGADEAFKLVSKAFQVLSDPQKRAAYDANPKADPDSRSGRAAASFNGRQGFEGEVSPEELFNMFFGGGPFGNVNGFGSFGGAPVFTATFGGGRGFRTTQFAGRQRNAGGEQAQPRSLIFQLLPLILLFAFSFLSAIPNLFSTAPPPDPTFSLSRTTYYNAERATSALHIPYFVHDREFKQHPIWVSIPEDMRGAKEAGLSSPNLYRFETNVEKAYLYNDCQRATSAKRQKIDELTGFLGIGADWKEINKVRAERISSCEELSRRGWI